MQDRARWMGLLLVLVWIVTGCGPAGEVETPSMIQDGFEDGLAAWQLGADVPADPNNPGHPVAWDIQLSDEQAASGQQSARLTLDGLQDDGIVWLARSLDAPASGSVNVHLSFALWSPSESFNTLAYAAAYAGSQPPTVEEDFDTAQPADQVEGWRTYEYDLAANPGPHGEIWIAVGISVVWEAEVVYYIDDVQVTFVEGPPAPLGAEQPPTAWLVVGDSSQESGIGSYCWTTPGAFGQGVSVCADTMGVITPAEPLALPDAPVNATFRVPLENPAGLSLNVFAATEASEVASGAGDGHVWRTWVPGEGERVELAPGIESGVELVLDPGLYVLSLFARWDGLGDVNYGWLVRVGAEGEGAIESGLVVEEHAIVADAVDKPTHLEYMDRIDPAILARREPWRGVDPELRAARANELLAPFGYRLEPRFDAEWGMTFFDLYTDRQDEPLLPGLMNFWLPSVSVLGDKFVMAVENAPNSGRPYLLVTEEWVDEWRTEASAFLPPVYAGQDMMALEVTLAQGVDLGYTVVRGGQAAYTDSAFMAVTMPLRSLTGWGEHWALEVDDRVILDGQDLGAQEGYEAVFGFHVLGGEPFYFFRQDGVIHMSYAGQTLPQTYHQVVHNECCEPSMFNVDASDSMVWFHALREGTWYYVEAGLFDEEPAAPGAQDLP